ncbi:MAG: GNAT family N-acetyltransferase [Rhodospirillaceae bacterium]|nr:GNAT family N-acetyltransferase [Rhodospirillaceae bacterium]MBT4773546.1 GNAT family N-acetyltransferase [Rhodospirillaceae bacterium]MBT5358012.1 GNAT family N-acetyltransferase [Rhodospirillaceae bacterium]MBT5769253.1 GNAT family N-acetyltransferase [Rhodospirillaceae bacterium]MBT6309962.1 GNAT family N-acetyltransferase [Rhodospirillaceae bacterium]
MTHPKAANHSQIYMKSGDTSLRAFRPTDIGAFRRWWDNFEVTQNMESGWRPSTEAIAGSMTDLVEADDRAIVFAVEAGAGRLIGSCGLYEIFWPGRRAEFRIMLGEPDVFGEGHGTRATRMVVEYAFKRANMEVVHLGVNADNVAAVKAYENAGFVREGVRRRFVFAAGEYHDAIVMSILRDEYLEHFAAG